MAIFGRQRRVEPPPPYGDEWFSRYWDDVFQQSGVADDGQNRIQLVMMTLKVLDDQAFDWFRQLNDSRAPSYYSSLIDKSAPIGERTSYLLSWNPTVSNLMQQKLEKFHGIFIQAGQRHGHFRFFPSPCHEQPIEFNLETGMSACSACGSPQNV